MSSGWHKCARHGSSTHTRERRGWVLPSAVVPHRPAAVVTSSTNSALNVGILLGATVRCKDRKGRLADITGGMQGGQSILQEAGAAAAAAAGESASSSSRLALPSSLARTTSGPAQMAASQAASHLPLQLQCRKPAFKAWRRMQPQQDLKTFGKREKQLLNAPATWGAPARRDRRSPTGASQGPGGPVLNCVGRNATETLEWRPVKYGSTATASVLRPPPPG